MAVSTFQAQKIARFIKIFSKLFLSATQIKILFLPFLLKSWAKTQKN